jgi:hypothetical protein
VARRVRIEIKGKDEFWERAFHVEWQDQFSDRSLLDEGEGCYRVESEWLADLDRVGSQVFCRVVRAPDRPERRRWFTSVLKRLH